MGKYVKDVPVKGTLFVVPTDDGRYAGVYNGEQIGLSKHQDYFLCHFKRGNVKIINETDIKRFAYGNSLNKVVVVEDAPTRGSAKLRALKQAIQAEVKTITVNAVDAAMLKRLFTDL